MIIIPKINNKSGKQPNPKLEWTISTGDVIQHLQDNVLGFNLLKYDFTRWVGFDREYSYVRMRAVIDPADIVAPASKLTYAERIVNATGGGYQFKNNVYRSLQQFMYPDTVANLRNEPEELARLAECGLAGTRLDEVITFHQLAYNPYEKVFSVYLRPERIIVDMLTDATTDTIEDNFAITKVEGTTTDTIVWTVIMTGNKTERSFAGAQDINIDRIFQTRV